MGRRENAVADVTKQLTELVLWLRAQRRLRGLTYAAMAQKTNYTASMLSRAANGRTVPSWKVVEAYTRACRADLRTAKRLWKTARWADQQQRGRDRTEEFLNAAIAAKFYNILAAKPQLIDTFAKLRLGMIGLRAKNGHPSLVELQERAGRAPNGRRRLPASSLGAVLRSEASPRRGHVTAFVAAMGAPPDTVLAWAEAWERAAGKTRLGSGARALRPYPPVPGLPADGPQTSPWPAVVVRSSVSMRGALIDNAPEMPQQQDAGAPSGFEDDIGLKPEDVAFLQTHGLLIGRPRPCDQPPSALGPVPPLPPAGYTAAGLPIRVPRRRRWRPRTLGGPSFPGLFMQMWLHST
ncbi:helix-turn-helix domain-containing protein [Kitasatospora purpeofusca]|uniref:helix-turn-helix domain-containing protein n=1 Tax=Kitasatospora purpeofusca TaxID=67352 RepID=UPI00381B41D3